MIPIPLVYSVSGMNDSFMNGGIGGQYLPQYNISADIKQYYSPGVLLNLLCSVHTYRLTILRSFFCSDIDHNDHYYHDPYNHICHLWIKPVILGQIQARYTKKWMVEFVSGVDQDNVLLGQHESRPEPH